MAGAYLSCGASPPAPALPRLLRLCVTLLSLSNVGVSFGATELFKNVTFTVAEGERWGIIGRNGAGKSSIFKLITGELQPTVGSVARKPGLRHALLDQHRAFEGATTVWEAGAAAWRDVIALEKRIAEQAIELGELGERVTDAFLEQFGHDQERFADLGGYIYHARVDAVLQGLGFDAEESKTRPVSSLSGGERGRVGLAAQLIAPADLLLLDEPTNHLDLDTTTWLQEWLSDANETVIVVSHDRAFLDAISTHILHVEARTSEWYRGNYSEFVPQRAERRLTRERELEKQRAYVKKEEEYIRRNIAGVNSFQAKGKRKRLERLPRLAPPPGDPAAMDAEVRGRRTRRRSGDRDRRSARWKCPAACSWRISPRAATERLRRARRTERRRQDLVHLHDHRRSCAGEWRREDRRIDHAGLVSAGSRRPAAPQVDVRRDPGSAARSGIEGRCRTISALSASAARRCCARSAR